MRLSYGRCSAGTTPRIKVPGIRSSNITVIAAMTTQGLMYFSILDGNGTRERFLHFLDDLAFHRDRLHLPNNSIIIFFF